MGIEIKTSRRRAGYRSRVHVQGEGVSLVRDDAVLPRVLRRLGLPADTSWRWSRTAGCSCGCSPGYVLGDHLGLDVGVTVT